MPSYDFYPKPIDKPGPHEIVMRDSDSNEVIGVGRGDDDTEALRDLIAQLIAAGASRSAVRKAGHLFRVAHKSQSGSEPPFDNSPQYCPGCGVSAEEHKAGECLDRWVHQAFLAEELVPGAIPPGYSDTEGLRRGEVDLLILHRGWPYGWVVVGTEEGVVVGEKLADREDGTFAVRQVSAGPTFEVAVSRAAAATPPWGDDLLEVRVGRRNP